MAKRSKRTTDNKTATTKMTEPLIELLDTAVPEPAGASAAPDPGALLANERVLSTWCQTSILLQIGGFGLTQLGNSTLRGPVGTLLILAGAFVAVAGYQRYQRFGQLLRGMGDDVTVDRRPLAQVAVLAGLAVLMAGLQIAGIW